MNWCSRCTLIYDDDVPQAPGTEICVLCAEQIAWLMRKSMEKKSHPYYPTVTLTDDPGFKGYSFGRYYDAQGNATGEIMVSVADPGASGLCGCVRIARERLVVVG